MKKILVFLLCISCNYLAASAYPQENDVLAKKQYESCMKYIQALDISNPKYKTIVELGCSTAKVSHELALHYPEKQFIAIDYDEKAFVYATKRCQEQANVACINNSIETYDLEEYGIPPADLTTCYHVLHWIEHNELPTAFATITKNMAPNGIVDINALTKQEACSITRAAQDTLLLNLQWNDYAQTVLSQVIAAQKNISYITIEELKSLAIDAKLNVLVCEKKEESYHFRCKKEFRSFLHACLTYYGIENCMNKAAQSTFIKDVAKRYREKYNPSEDPKQIAYRFFSLHLTAQK